MIGEIFRREKYALLYENKIHIFNIKENGIMMKKVLVLGMALVTIMLCGCGNKPEEMTYEEKTEAIEAEISEYSSNEAWFVHNFYPAVECILNEEIRNQDVSYDDNGFWIDDRYVSYDEIDKHISICDGENCI